MLLYSSSVNRSTFFRKIRYLISKYFDFAGKSFLAGKILQEGLRRFKRAGKKRGVGTILNGKLNERG